MLPPIQQKVIHKSETNNNHKSVNVTETNKREQCRKRPYVYECVEIYLMQRSFEVPHDLFVSQRGLAFFHNLQSNKNNTKLGFPTRMMPEEEDLVDCQSPLGNKEDVLEGEQESGCWTPMMNPPPSLRLDNWHSFR